MYTFDSEKIYIIKEELYTIDNGRFSKDLSKNVIRKKLKTD